MQLCAVLALLLVAGTLAVAQTRNGPRKVSVRRQELSAEQLEAKLNGLSGKLPKELAEARPKFGRQNDNEDKSIGGLLLVGEVSVGTPEQHFQLAFPLHLSQAWLIGENATLHWNLARHAVKKYSQSGSATSKDGDLPFHTPLRFATGKYASDQVRIGGQSHRLTFGVASSISHWYGLLPVDGEFGLSPAPRDDRGIGSPLSQLLPQMAQPVLSIWMDKQSIFKKGNAQINFGQLDSVHCAEDWTWTEMRDSNGWHFHLDSVSVGAQRIQPIGGTQSARLIDEEHFIIGPKSHVKMIANALGATDESIFRHPIYGVGPFAFCVHSAQVYNIACSALHSAPNLVFNAGVRGDAPVVLTPENYIIKTPGGLHCILALVSYPDQVKSFGYFMGERFVNGRCFAFNQQSQQIGFASAKH